MSTLSASEWMMYADAMGRAKDSKVISDTEAEFRTEEPQSGTRTKKPDAQAPAHNEREEATQDQDDEASPSRTLVLRRRADRKRERRCRKKKGRKRALEAGRQVQGPLNPDWDAWAAGVGFCTNPLCKFHDPLEPLKGMELQRAIKRGECPRCPSTAIVPADPVTMLPPWCMVKPHDEDTKEPWIPG